MLTVVYDLLRGHADRDGEVIDRLDLLLATHAANKALPEYNLSVSTANSTFIVALQVAVAKKQIAAEDVKLYHRTLVYESLTVSRELRIYESGGISPRPEGFCDLADNLRREML